MGQPKKRFSALRHLIDYFRSDGVFALSVTLAHFAGALFLALHHEIWRDEFIPLMTGRGSHSIAELLTNIRYEGHAPGWYLVMYAVTRLTGAPEAMQVVHVLIASASVYLLARFAPFPKAWRVLYAFGFYPFYQYAAISRGYALCVLLLFSFCALYDYRRTKLVWLAAVVGLLAIADTYGWFMSLALSATLVFAWAYDRKLGTSWTNGRMMTAASMSIIAAGVIWSAVVTMPPPDCGTYTHWHTHFSWQRLAHVVHSLNFDYNVGSRDLYVPFNIVAFVVVLLWFARRRVALFMFSVFTVAVALFYYLKFDIVVYWHKGMVFEYFIACVWIYRKCEDEGFGSRLIERATLFGRRAGPALMWIVLLFFVVYGLKWERNDVRKPYTCGKAVARYIRTHFPPDIVLAGDSDFAATSIVGYLDRPVYYPASDRFGTYLLYDNRRHWPITMDELYTGVHRVSAATGKDMLLALTYELPRDYAKRLNATLIRHFGGSIMVDEDFWLYRVRPPRKGSNASSKATE